MTRPMLDDVELPQAQRIASEDEEALAQHGVPALEGDFLQNLGRRAVRVTLTGVLTGPEAGEGLKGLREKFHAAEPVPFVSDIGTATKVDRVLIEEMGVRELGGKTERFEYALSLREYTPPPAVTEEAPPDIPPPPVPVTATLVVEVTAEGEPDFDFSRVQVTATRTGTDGLPVARTLSNRSGNVWTEEDFPPGQHTVQAVTGEPGPRTGSASAEVREGETKQVSLTLQSGAVVAHRFIVHFWFDKAFVEPCMREALQRVGDYSNAHPDEKLLIVGHTDLVGDEGVPSSGIRYNQSLAERRARAVFAFMTFGRDRAAALADWNELRRTRTSGVRQTLNDSWSTREYQYMLQDLGFYAGLVDEDHGTLTTAAIRDFQRDQGLTVNGTMDGPTWSALIEAYLDRDPPAIPESRFLPNASGDCNGGILKWLGCEEQDPVRNTQDAWRPNRRVELLFVRTDRLPCEQPQPDTFDLPAPGAVGSGWCLGPGDRSQRVCFVTPALQPCSGGPAWCRQPAEPGTVTVRGRIAQDDGTPLANARFFLIAPDGLYLHTDPAGAADLGEVSSGPQRGRPVLDRTDANGEFSFPDPTPVGTYILEVQEPVVVRLADDPGLEAKGNVVCKRMDGTSDFNVLVCGGVATTFELEVENATRIGGAGSNVFVATRLAPGVAGDDVLITAVTPAGTCAAPRSVTWTGGLEVRGHPLQRRVPRASAGQTTVTATMSPSGVTRTVEIFVVRVTLDVDADRDGTVEVDGTAKDVWEFGAGRKGAVLFHNCDDDDADGARDGDDLAVGGAGDVFDLAPLVVRQSGPLPAGVELVLQADPRNRIRIFDGRLATSTPILGPGPALPAEVVVPGTQTADVELGMEALDYARPGFDGLIRLRLILRSGGNEFDRDDVVVRVAPWVMPSHLQEALELFVVQIAGFNTSPASPFLDQLQSAATAAGVPLRRITDPVVTAGFDVWIQDSMEVGYSRVPARSTATVVNAANPRELRDFAFDNLLGPDLGFHEPGNNIGFNTFDSHGNLEVSPPVTLPSGEEFKLGRIYFGRGRIASRFNPRVRRFLESQLVQKPFAIDTNWLSVGHVDEIISFVPSAVGRSFRMLFADTRPARAILQDLLDSGQGDLPLFEGKTRSPFQERTVEEILTDPDLMAGNDLCQARLNGVEAVMRAELGLAAADIVRIPSLFVEVHGSGFFAALIPGMVNMLVITRPTFADTQLAIPRPFGPVVAGVDRMERDVRTKLQALGYAASQIHFVDDYDTYHVGEGEVHCGTNSRRGPHATPWWEQVDF